MMVSIDQNLERLTDALKHRGMWDNTILLFTTDNGGQTWFGSSNYPLRGGKKSLYDGALKGVGFLTGGWIENKRVSGKDFNQLVHISDIYPTLLSIVNRYPGVNHDIFPELKRVDGVDLSDNLLFDKNSDDLNQRVVVLHYDDDTRFVVRYGKWKLIKGYGGIVVCSSRTIIKRILMKDCCTY